MEDPKLWSIVIALVAVILTATPDFGEAFGVASPIAIVLPAGGDGSVATVCGILAKQLPRIIQCSTITTAGAGKAFDISPNVTFTSISSGRDIICGRHSGTAFCWRHGPVEKRSAPTNQNLKIIYQKIIGAFDLVVGEEQIAAVNMNSMFVRRQHANSSFPESVPGHFRSLTSGAGFVCAINDEDKVVCWGPKAENIYSVFEDEEMLSIFSGESHACGITKEGRVICGGNDDHGQSSPPEFDTPSGMTILALGSSHTCAIGRNKTYILTCWGDGVGEYTPSNGLELLSVVAAGNLTCGVRADNLLVLCWWTSRGAPAKLLQVPFSRGVVFGLCIAPSFCPCGKAIYSEFFCADINAICRPCITS